MSLPLTAPAPALHRPARIADAPAMAELINGFAAQGLMLPKTVPDLARAFREYRVATDPDGRLVGCGGLRIYNEDLAEIVGLAVAEDAHGRRIGATLVEDLVEEARTLGIARVFAMTFQVDFFGRQGFTPIPIAFLPEKTAADCRTCARRVGCKEVAVMRVLEMRDVPPPPVPTGRGPALRVLHTPM